MDISKLVDAFLTGVNLDGLVKISSILLKCPILILDDAFHVVSYYKSEDFQDIPFDSTIESKHITYEVVRNLNWQPNLKKPVFLSIEESPWRRRVSTLRAEHKNIGYLFCVDVEGHLEQVSDNDMYKIEMILAKQYLAQIENQFLSKNTEEEILTHLLDGDYQNPALFKLQITNTWLEQMDQGHLVLIDVSNRTNLQMSYQKNILLFIHEKRQVEILETIAKEFQVCVVVSSVIKDIYELPKVYKQILEVTSLLQNRTFSAKVFYTEGYRLRLMLDQMKSRFDLVPDVYKKMYDYDKENHTVYCETLYYYELKNHSVIETAAELFTHRNTIVYRLRKIKDMFHIDDAHESEKLIRLISLGLCLIKMNQDDIVLEHMHAGDIFEK